ncbi:protein of unknown function [Candidatus Nitrosocosmicus franklandus]|uniref:Uncharacterized protein n=1 Tax=Candidatus Nitrosocosmicus franklandianus TaxID=1798806 RepID=A0A484IDA1_9ARCH|nr:protein of unknown function [Candidatus Nitrosocosmicus franklandus]
MTLIIDRLLPIGTTAISRLAGIYLTVIFYIHSTLTIDASFRL